MRLAPMTSRGRWGGPRPVRLRRRGRRGRARAGGRADQGLDPSLPAGGVLPLGPGRGPGAAPPGRLPRLDRVGSGRWPGRRPSRCGRTRPPSPASPTGAARTAPSSGGCATRTGTPRSCSHVSSPTAARARGTAATRCARRAADGLTRPAPLRRGRPGRDPPRRDRPERRRPGLRPAAAARPPRPVRMRPRTRAPRRPRPTTRAPRRPCRSGRAGRRPRACRASSSRATSSSRPAGAIPAAATMPRTVRTQPSMFFSTTLPVNPSVTTTSTVPASTSCPSTLPWKRTGALGSSPAAARASRFPLAGSAPMDSSPTDGSATPRTVRA